MAMTRDEERDCRIVELILQGLSTKEVAEQIGVSRQTVVNVCHHYGIDLPKRSKKSPEKKTKHAATKKCPICKAHNNPLNTKFCCMCGADIRSEADILIEKLNKSMDICCSLLPVNSTEPVRDSILQAIKYIETSERSKKV